MVAPRGERSSRPRRTTAESTRRPAMTISMPGGGHMRHRSLGLTVFAGLAILVTACGGGATPSPSASAPASEPPAASEPAGSDRSVRVGGPVGRAGAGPEDRPRHRRRHARTTRTSTSTRTRAPRRRAAAIGAAAHDSGRPEGRRGLRAEHPGVRRPGLRRHRHRRLQPRRRHGKAAAKANPDVKFIGVDQAPICVDERATPDTTFACTGDADDARCRTTWASSSQEDQAGYLAGIVAAARQRDRARSAPSAGRASAARRPLHPGL